MAISNKIKSLDEIKNIKVHWSESQIINEELGVDNGSDIEKNIEAVELDLLVKKASSKVGLGYDKTVLTVTLIDESIWCKDRKFYLTNYRNTLLDLLGDK